MKTENSFGNKKKNGKNKTENSLNKIKRKTL